MPMFSVYLCGMKFELYDNPLEMIHSSKSKPYAWTEWWILCLQLSKFKVKHLPGEHNIADPLSWLFLTEEQVNSSLAQVSDEIAE